METTVNGDALPETAGNALVRLEDIPGGHAACDAEVSRERAKVSVLAGKLREAEGKLGLVEAHIKAHAEHWALHLDDDPEEWVRTAPVLAIITGDGEPAVPQAKEG